MIWENIVLTLFIYFLHWLWKRRKTYYLSLKVKNNEMIAFPLIGHSYIFLGNDEDRMKAFQRLGRIAVKNNGLTKVWIGPRLYLVVVEPKYLDRILKSCLDKDDMLGFAKDLLGNGSVFAPVPIWRRRRKVMAPTFNTKNLNQFVNLFSENIRIMVKKLEFEDGKGPFSLWKYLATFSMDSICESAFGIKVNAQINLNHPFLNAFEHHLEMASTRLCLPLFIQEITKYLPYYKTYMKPINLLTEFIEKIVENKRNEIEERSRKTYKNRFKTETKKKSFLELFINSSGGESGFTNLELREETLVLVLAGTDTSAVGSGFASLMLAMHPHVQQTVYEEVKSVLGDRPITAEDLLKLKYLEMVVKETLRLYPPVPIIVRKLDRDIELSNGVKLYKDTPTIVNIWATHRNPEYWGSDAEQFRPERFIDSTPEHPAAFIPFSLGPRSCLGYRYAMMSMKTAVASLIRQYKLLPPPSHVKLPLRVKFGIMMKHVDNFEIQLEKRKSYENH